MGYLWTNSARMDDVKEMEGVTGSGVAGSGVAGAGGEGASQSGEGVSGEEKGVGGEEAGAVLSVALPYKAYDAQAYASPEAMRDELAVRFNAWHKEALGVERSDSFEGARRRVLDARVCKGALAELDDAFDTDGLGWASM